MRAQAKLHILIRDGLRFRTVCPKGKFILAAAERGALVDWHQFVQKKKLIFFFFFFPAFRVAFQGWFIYVSFCAL